MRITQYHHSVFTSVKFAYQCCHGKDFSSIDVLEHVGRAAPLWSVACGRWENAVDYDEFRPSRSGYRQP